MTVDTVALASMIAGLSGAEHALGDRTPGGVAAIVRGASVTGSIAFGCANLTSGLMWSIDLPGRIASVSKPMAAQVLLRLCDQGAIDLDMRFGDVLSLSPSWADVRLRDALAMKAGLPDEYPLIALATGGGISDHHDLDHRFALLRTQSHLNFPAGTRTLYANTGYTLAQRLAETVTGKPFADLLAREVFAPAGMRTARFGAAAAPLGRDMGLGTRKAASGDVEPMELWIDVGAAGGVIASMADLIAWHIWNRGQASDLWRRLAHPVTHVDGSVSAYALGVERKMLSGLATEGHSGGISGWACDYVRLPSLDAAVIVLANRTDVNWYERIREAAITAFGLAPDPAATPRLLTPTPLRPEWEGCFGDRVGGRSYIVRACANDAEFEGRRYPRGADGAFRRVLGAEPIVIEGLGAGVSAPESITVLEGNVTAQCRAAAPLAPSCAELCGVYRAESMPGRIVIAEIGGALHAVFGWSWPATAPMRLSAIFPDLWRGVDAHGAPSDFHFFWPDLTGDPAWLDVSTARLVRFPYRRLGDAQAAAWELTWTAGPTAQGSSI